MHFVAELIKHYYSTPYKKPGRILHLSAYTFSSIRTGDWVGVDISCIRRSSGCCALTNPKIAAKKTFSILALIREGFATDRAPSA